MMQTCDWNGVKIPIPFLPLNASHFGVRHEISEVKCIKVGRTYQRVTPSIRRQETTHVVAVMSSVITPDARSALAHICQPSLFRFVPLYNVGIVPSTLVRGLCRSVFDEPPPDGLSIEDLQSWIDSKFDQAINEVYDSIDPLGTPRPLIGETIDLSGLVVMKKVVRTERTSRRTDEYSVSSKVPLNDLLIAIQEEFNESFPEGPVDVSDLVDSIETALESMRTNLILSDQDAQVGVESTEDEDESSDGMLAYVPSGPDLLSRLEPLLKLANIRRESGSWVCFDPDGDNENNEDEDEDDAFQPENGR